MKIKKLFLSFVALAAVFGLAACNDGASVSGITISAKDNVHEIQVDDTLQLTATVFPENAKNKNVEWSVSNTSTASVSESGLVKGLAVGTVDIIATSVENKNISQKYALVVKEKAATVVTPTSIELVGADKVKEVAVGDTIRLESIVKPDGASQQVVWSSSDNTLATVSTRGEVTGVKEGKVTITVTAKDVTTVKASVELTVVKGNSSSGDFASMPITSHANFMEAEKGTPVKVKGIVTHVAPVAEGKVSYYIQNGVDGYYIYGQNASTYPVEEGKCYEVGGLKQYYQGKHEIIDVSYLKEINNTLTFTYNDVKGKDVSSLEAMKPYHNSYIEGEGIITNTPAVAEKAYNVNVTIEGKAIVLRIDPNNMTTSEFEAFGNLFKSVVANTSVQFKGIMTAFGHGKASTQIQILKSSELVVKEASPEDQVAAIKSSLLIPTALNLETTKIDLPTTVSGFKDISISWASDNAAVINAADQTVNHSEEDIIVTLTATITHSKNAEIKETKTFKVIVLGSVFEHELLVTLDCEDALTEGGQYGTSGTKPNYSNKDGSDVVELGTPKLGWLLKNALIAKDNRTDGLFSIRMQNNADPTLAGRVEIQQSGEYNFIQFDGTTFNNDDPINLGIEYVMDGTTEWVDAGFVFTMNNTLTTYRVALPEGAKRIAIYIIGTNGKRANLDNIKLFK